jgi:hypothetical protein
MSMLNLLPLSIQNLFNRAPDGALVASFNNSCEAGNCEAALRREGVSYKTKITKSKKHGRRFMVMLLTPTSGANP